MYAAINRNIILPLYLHKSRNRVLGRLSELNESQYYSADTLKEMQVASLKRLLIHSYRHVPFYRARFDAAGFRPEKFDDPAELQRIPYLTKTDIQNNLQQLLAQNYDRLNLVADASGGSTGKPTRYFKDRYRHQIRRADQFRHDGWTGWQVGEKFATLWGAQREFDEKPSLKSRLVDRFVHRVYGFNAFDISEARVLNYLDELRRIGPTMILAYANVAVLFARLIHRHGIDLTDLNLKGIVSSAETLSSGNRNLIESAFGCKVLNRYGSREVGLIASECALQEGLHLNAENVFVEIQRDGKDVAPGERGEVIATDLWNYGMPFIRYQLGDVAVSGDKYCRCGRGLPLLQEVTGRVSDFIVDERGGLVHGEYFTHLFYGIDGVEQFQLVQESLEEIVLRILPRDSFSHSLLAPVIARIKLCLGDRVRVSVRLCDSSFVESSGKFRFTISKLTGAGFDIANRNLRQERP